MSSSRVAARGGDFSLLGEVLANRESEREIVRRDNVGAATRGGEFVDIEVRHFGFNFDRQRLWWSGCWPER